MKNQILTVAALSFCLLTVPSWAMDDNLGHDGSARVKNVQQAAACSTDNVAIVEDADDSSSSSSSGSESDSGPAKDKKSKQFFVYIANPSAGSFYENLVSNHHFSVTDWKRENVKSNSVPGAEKFFRKSKGVQRLCRTMKSTLKKFDATQTCKEVKVNGKDKGMLVTLVTREEQSAKAVAKCCRQSEYVYKVFSDEADLNTYLISTASSSSNSFSSSQAQQIHQLARLAAMMAGLEGLGSKTTVVGVPGNDSDSESL